MGVDILRNEFNIKDQTKLVFQGLPYGATIKNNILESRSLVRVGLEPRTAAIVQKAQEAQSFDANGQYGTDGFDSRFEASPHRQRCTGRPRY